ncbi:MAG: sugar-binding domain-containing protein, partial [Saprospiraceae bacterium]
MRPTLALVCFLAFFAQTSGQTPLLFADDFSGKNDSAWTAIGPGEFEFADSKLKTQNSKLLIAGDENWTDYELKFRARAPENAEQVQIWASLRLQSRDDRYTFGFRGGNHDDVLLARYGHLGTDEFLAIRPLDFHPEPGAWFELRFLVFGDHLMLFVNPSTQNFNFSTAKPIVHVRDSSHLKSGKIALGGGWLPTEYDDVQVRRLEKTEIERLENLPEIGLVEPAEQKEARRKIQRAAYQPLKIATPDSSQAEIPLDGDWLFLPDYQLTTETAAVNPDSSDAHWHVLRVPEFWNENRVWLHGEDAMMRSGDKGVSDNYRQLDQKRCESYTFDYRKTNIGYYRQWLTVDGRRQTADGSHPSFLIHFAAVSKIAKVWLNGQFVGEHVGMFAPFEFDVSRFLRPGRNLLVVKVVKNYTNLADGDRVADLAESVGVTKKMLNDLPHGIYAHDPAGIWQPVKLLIRNSLHIADVFVRPNLTGAAVDVFIKNDGPTKRTVSLDLEVVESPPSRGRGAVLFSQKNMATWTLAPGSSAEKTVEFGDLAPKLWSPEHPNLYELRLVLRAPLPPEGGAMPLPPSGGGGRNETPPSGGRGE